MTSALSQELLAQIGLNDSESKLYRQLLEDGTASAAELSKKTAITRTNTYNVLQQLEIRGLVTRHSEGTKALFSAEHPNSLYHQLDREEGRLRSTRSQLTAVMNELVALYSVTEAKPGVFRFEGRQGLVKVYSELLRDRLDVRSIQDRGRLRDFIPDFNPIWLRERRRRKMFARVISVASEATSKIEADDKFELRTVRYVDSDLLPFNMDLKITEKKVVMTTFVKDSAVGIMIIDQVITKNFILLFEFIWQMLENQRDKN